jgi:hypothetical protein
MYTFSLCYDGFAQSINLWSQKDLLLGNKHIPNSGNNRSVTDIINAFRGNDSINTVQHTTIDEAVFSMSPAPRPLLVTDQWTRSLTRDTCFLWGPYRRLIADEKNRLNQNPGELSSVQEAVKRRLHM